MNGLKVIDLFSGSGGSAVGFAQAGFEIAVAVDIDKAASATFKANFPLTTVINSDIKHVTGESLLKLVGTKNGDDIVMIACPPCQGFSNARRKSQAMSDPRNNLIHEFVRIVDEIKTVAFVMENVAGLVNGIGKNVFEGVLKRLNNLGYRTIYDVVDCADYGVPQRRKRLVVIGTRLPDLRILFPRKTNQNPNSPDTYLPAWKTVREVISDLPEIKAGDKDKHDPLHTCANLSEINLKRLEFTPSDGGDRLSWPEELTLACHKNMKGYKDVYGRMKWDTPSPTMTGGCGMISKGRFGHPKQHRAISLREAARLQTFPNNFVFTGNFGQIAEQIGNAVPPLLARRIAESLLESLEDLAKSRKLLNGDETTGPEATFV